MKLNLYNVTYRNPKLIVQAVSIAFQVGVLKFFVMGRRDCLWAKCCKRASGALSRMNGTLISSDGR
jgi:radical SAM superfamily enzyme with C-terminal helix-hairpin-helix motif